MKRASYADFIGIPRKVADSAAFKSLPALARALYFDLRRQHNGHNNGQIAAVIRGTEDRPGLERYGWSPRTVFKLLKVLLAHGLIEKTRQGGIGAMSKLCTLYAFTDLAVVGNREKGITASVPSLAYLGLERRVEAAPRASIAAPRAPSQLHMVPSDGAVSARDAACDSTRKRA